MSNIRQRTLFHTGKYADLTVKCGGHTWQLHRAILCGESEFFERLCDGSFREAKEQCVTLEDEDPIVAAQAFHFMYMGKFVDIMSFKSAESPWETGQFSRVNVGFEQFDDKYVRTRYICACLYAFGDKYLVAAIKKTSYGEFLDWTYLAPNFIVQKSTEKMRKWWSRVGPTWLTWNKDTIKIVYSTTPDSDRGLRDLVLVTYHEWNLLFQLQKSETMEELVHECPEFAWDVISKPLRQPLFWCNVCKRITRVLGPRICRCSIPGRCASDRCEEEDKKALKCIVCQRLGSLSREESFAVENSGQDL